MHLAQAPSHWVQRWSSLIRPQSEVLDLACGSGRHALWLAEQGFQVTAVDRDAAALAEIGSRAQRRVQTEAMDLEGDVWPLAGRTFDAVVVTNYLWRPRWPDLMDLLRDGGVLIYETFSIDHASIGRPSREAFLLNHGELLTRCAGWRVVAFEDGFDAQAPRFVQRIAAIKPSASKGAAPARHALPA